MSKRIWTVCAILGALSLMACAETPAHGRDVVVEVVNANGASFDQFPVSSRGDALRAYLEAERNAPYRIRIRNCTDRRVAVVVAVDGRNIISGAQSDLARGEPMYILGPYETQDYSGWRTSLTDVHEFYFTEWKDSYAEAFGDRSARGVIAVAVYREKARPVPKLSVAPGANEESRSKDAPAPAADAAAAGNVAQSRAQKLEAEPGTGFGEQRYEPATRIEFDAERRASARVFLKYEWQETLCAKGVIDCDERNRFWNDDLAFAPFPPGRAR
jgi:hypothetical protein